MNQFGVYRLRERQRRSVTTTVLVKFWPAGEVSLISAVTVSRPRRARASLALLVSFTVKEIRPDETFVFRSRPALLDVDRLVLAICAAGTVSSISRREPDSDTSTDPCRLVPRCARASRTDWAARELTAAPGELVAARSSGLADPLAPDWGEPDGVGVLVEVLVVVG